MDSRIWGRIDSLSYSSVVDSLKQFVESYRGSGYAWASTFINAIFAILVPGGVSYVLRVVIVFFVFVIPILIYYHRNAPFGLRCNYYQDSLTTPDSVADVDGVVRLGDGENIIGFKVTVGGAIDKYGIEFAVPDSMTISLYDKPASHHRLKNGIYSSEKRKPVKYNLYLVVDTGESGLSPSRSHRMQILGRESGRLLEEVSFTPE